MPHRSTAGPRCAAAAVALLALTGCGGQPARTHATSSATIAGAQPPPRAAAPPSRAAAPPRPVAAAPPPRAAAPPSAAPALPDAAAQHAAPALPDAAAQDAAIGRLAAAGRTVYCGGGTRRLVALTFDDGPGPTTGAMLRALRRAAARATFFLVGRSVDRFAQWPRRQRERGAIGTHTQTHADLTALSRAGASAEIAGGRDAALRAAGAPVDLFRAPYGRRTRAIDREVRRQGMLEVLWSVNSTDSRRSPPAGFDATVAARVRRLVRPGSIVLMHENRAHTIRALRTILPALKRRHLRLVTVGELLAADPPSAAQLDAGERGCRAGAAARR